MARQYQVGDQGTAHGGRRNSPQELERKVTAACGHGQFVACLGKVGGRRTYAEDGDATHDRCIL